jgi:hypothetical protein
MKYLALSLSFFLLISSLITSPAFSEEISLAREKGVYELPVRINGVVTLNFVLDSGASDVSIPSEVVLTLVRTKTVSDDDFLPGRTYILGDGSKVKSPRFVIHNLKIGNKTIHSVPASISTVGSPLLLGQSLLERLGIWSVDNSRKVLIIESSDKDKQPVISDKEACDDRADGIFYKRHAELSGRKLRKDESDLSQEWQQVRNKLGDCSQAVASDRTNLYQNSKTACDDKTDAIFYKRHPELSGRRLRKDESDLPQEWQQLRIGIHNCK